MATNETHICWKCGGHGEIRNIHGGLAYPHRLGSVCYTCKGAGVLKGTARRTQSTKHLDATAQTPEVMGAEEMDAYWSTNQSF